MVRPFLAQVACSYQCPDQLQLLPGHWQTKRYWIFLDLQKPGLLENNPSNTSRNMKSDVKNKKNGSRYKFVELLIPIKQN